MKALSRWQRNDVFGAVQEAGLDPQEFDWDDTGDDISLRHQSSGAFFVFGGDAAKYVLRYSAPDEPDWNVEKYSWQALMESVSLWLANTKRDIDTPDLWGELLRQRGRLSDFSDESLENTPFTPQERDEIARQFHELRGYARTIKFLSESQLADLDSKLDYLVDAANRVGRKDWLLMCYGTMLGYFLTAALPSDAARDIFQTLMNSIAYLFGEGLHFLGS